MVEKKTMPLQPHQSLSPWPGPAGRWWGKASCPAASQWCPCHLVDPAWCPPEWWVCWGNGVSPQGTTRAPQAPTHRHNHTQMCTYGYTKDKVSERGEREESAGSGGRTSWPFPQWHSTNWVVATENIVIKFEWKHSCMNTRHPQAKKPPITSHDGTIPSETQRLYRGTPDLVKSVISHESVSWCSADQTTAGRDAPSAECLHSLRPQPTMCVSALHVLLE